MLKLHGSKTVGMLAVLFSVVSFAGTSNAAGSDADGTCPTELKKDDANAAMKPLFDAFQLVDKAFNGSATGLDPSYIATLGYFVERTEVIAYGPFQNLGALAPGATAAIGIAESSQLQAAFEGGLKAAFGPATTLLHYYPTVSAVFGANRRATVNTRADVFDTAHNLVAIVRGLAQYYIPCDTRAVPPIEWIHFTLQVLPPPAH